MIKYYYKKITNQYFIIYFRNNKIHREGAPAVKQIMNQNCGDWYCNGVYHNENGPAVYYGAYREWWINGKQVNKARFLKIRKKIRLKNKKKKK